VTFARFEELLEYSRVSSSKWDLIVSPLIFLFDVGLGGHISQFYTFNISLDV
jgi:hypothetical protein